MSVQSVSGSSKSPVKADNRRPPKYDDPKLQSIFDEAREERIKQLYGTGDITKSNEPNKETKVPKVEGDWLQGTSEPKFENAERSNSKNPQAAALINLVSAKFGEKFDVRINGEMILLAPKKTTNIEDRKIGDIREDLGVKPGVVSKNNTSVISGRDKLYDFATIDNGFYIQLPINELGQDVDTGILGFGSNKEEMAELQNAADAYKKTISK